VDTVDKVVWMQMKGKGRFGKGRRSGYRGERSSGYRGE
jgi:hypothetical protein